eukprot:TRINITY_DN84_c1_g1_i1.p1 TRINITY_DN84_c1_g1~~TRINITY_DN84_c1_g1_i1.p1  ORF type:complete len:351 (+),score=165.49 TRINITY_DN84_c1_g1_i1:95-1147(+)
METSKEENNDTINDVKTITTLVNPELKKHHHHHHHHHHHKPRVPGQRKDFHLKLYKTPKEIFEAIAIAGVAKSEVAWFRLIILGFLAGCFVGFGGTFAISIGGGCPGLLESNPGIVRLLFASCFTSGLFFIIITGGELFTGNTMYLTVAVLHRTHQVKWYNFIKSWIISYFANAAGTLFVSGILVYLTNLFDDEPWRSYVVAIGIRKVYALNWGQYFARAIGANWLVNIAIVMSIASEDIVSKIVGAFWPVLAFASIGFEHCIANMYFVPLAIWYDDGEINFATFLWKNLLPVTLGNIVGGAFFVGFAYWFVYLTESKPQFKKQFYHASSSIISALHHKNNEENKDKPKL